MTYARYLTGSLRQLREYWWVLILILVAAAILDAFPHSWIIRLAKIVLYVLAVVGIPTAIIGQKVALRAWGGRLQTRMAMIQLTLESEGGVAFEVALVMMKIGAVLAISALVSGGGWLSLGCYILTVGVSNYVRLCAPPLALFLGKSSDQSRRLADQLAHSLVPHRLVHALSFPNNDPSRASMLNTWIRDVDNENWAASVEFVMHNARILVVDGRGVTDQLMDEVQTIFTSELVSNTIFVCHERSQCMIFRPLVSRGSISRKSLVCVASDEFVGSHLRDLVIPPWTLSNHPLVAGFWKAVGEVSGESL